MCSGDREFCRELKENFQATHRFLSLNCPMRPSLLCRSLPYGCRTNSSFQPENFDRNNLRYKESFEYPYTKTERGGGLSLVEENKALRQEKKEKLDRAALEKERDESRQKNLNYAALEERREDSRQRKLDYANILQQRDALLQEKIKYDKLPETLALYVIVECCRNALLKSDRKLL